MTRRGLRRLLGVSASTLLVLVAGAFAWTAAASAHVVTGIEGDCTHVTVSFADFPHSGVTVHIAVTVGGHAPLTTDVLVKEHSGPVSLDITSVTSDLFGATANVDVDVTWSFQGPQHVEETLHVTCGETTSTAAVASSSAASSTSTTAAPVSSSTDTSETTSSTVESGSSTTEAGASSTSTSVGSGGGGGASTTSSTAGSGGRGAIKVAGESASSPSVTVAAAATGAGQSGNLPFTGGAAVPLLVLGVAALTGGAAAISAARRRRMTNP